MCPDRFGIGLSPKSEAVRTSLECSRQFLDGVGEFHDCLLFDRPMSRMRRRGLESRGATVLDSSAHPWSV